MQAHCSRWMDTGSLFCESHCLHERGIDLSAAMFFFDWQLTEGSSFCASTGIFPRCRKCAGISNSILAYLALLTFISLKLLPSRVTFAQKSRWNRRSNTLFTPTLSLDTVAALTRFQSEALSRFSALTNTFHTRMWI